MKMISISKILLIGILASSVFMTGCDNDDPFTLADCLSSSDWNVTSYRIDGVEYKGAAGIYSSVQLDFGEYNKADQRGSVTFTRIQNENGYPPNTTDVLSGNYEIFESTMEIDMSFDGFQTATFTVESCTEEGRLVLGGNVGGFYWEISAEL